MNAYGFIYRKTFNPLNPGENLLVAEIDRDSYVRFRLNIPLSGGTTYALVMTTYRSKETGPFLITVQGPQKVIVERLSKYIYVLIVQ